MSDYLYTLLTRGAIALFIALILGYGLFEARRLIEGPRISVTAPQDGATLPGPTIDVEGVVENAAFITVDGARVFADEHGFFSDRMAPPPGLAIIAVSATDRFGRTRTKTLEVVIEGSTTPQSATTTPTATSTSIATSSKKL